MNTENGDGSSSVWSMGTTHLPKRNECNTVSAVILII